MAPCVFNGIIFLFGSSIKPWRSLTSCTFHSVHRFWRTKTAQNSFYQTACNQTHVLHLEGNLSPVGKNSFLKHFIWPNWSSSGNDPIWSLTTTFGFCSTSNSQRMKDLNVLWVVLQRWSRAGWEWRRVQRNVHVSLTQGKLRGGWGGEKMTSTPLRSWALWPVALCLSLWSGCWCACGCVSSWTSPCRRPRLIAALTPSHQTRLRRPHRWPSLSGPFAPSPSALSAGETEIKIIVI